MEFEWEGEEGGVGMSAYSRWAQIRSRALTRIKTVCRQNHIIKPLSEDSWPDLDGVSWISEHLPSRKTAVN